MKFIKIIVVFAGPFKQEDVCTKNRMYKKGNLPKTRRYNIANIFIYFPELQGVAGGNKYLILRRLSINMNIWLRFDCVAITNYSLI